MEKEIIVSVICCAYNQEKYIEDALASFVMQETSFSFEVLVSDDASTDGTADIIRKYERDYPEIIRPVYFKENQYSKGNHPQAILCNMARGKYLALCEGDDYWISKDKLQKQFDAMEQHPECDMCAHSALMVRASDRKTIGMVEPRKDDGILTMEEVILGGGNYLATNSLFCRAELQRNPARFVVEYCIDYAIQMHGATRGGIYYLHETMSAYRRGAEQSWTLYMEKNQDVMIRHIHMMIEMLRKVDEDTEYRFSESIAQAIRKYEFQAAGYESDARTIYSRKYADLRKALTPKKQFILFLKCFAPWSLRLWQKVKRH